VKDLVEKGQLRLKTFSSDFMAEELLKAYRRVLDGDQGGQPQRARRACPVRLISGVVLFRSEIFVGITRKEDSHRSGLRLSCTLTRTL
jgi:hypothetical protein